MLVTPNKNDIILWYFQLFQKQVDNQHDTERYSIKGRSEPNIITILRTSVYWEREREREREREYVDVLELAKSYTHQNKTLSAQ